LSQIFLWIATHVSLVQLPKRPQRRKKKATREAAFLDHV
jgi:hypothetical protein